LYYRNEFIETTTLTSKTLGKNEGEGNIFSLGKVEDLNITTLNPQTLVYCEGDGKEIDTEIADGIIPPTLFTNAVEFENEEQSTLNPQYLLGNEGEGKEENLSYKSHCIYDDDDYTWTSALEDLMCINDSNQAYVVNEQDPVDPIFEKINSIISESHYREDEEFYNAVNDFYANGLIEIRKEPIEVSILVAILCDQYTLCDAQSNYLIDIFIELEKIRINEFYFVEIVK
jgi:hypothetical protein